MQYEEVQAFLGIVHHHTDRLRCRRRLAVKEVTLQVGLVHIEEQSLLGSTALFAQLSFQIQGIAVFFLVTVVVNMLGCDVGSGTLRFNFGIAVRTVEIVLVYALSRLELGEVKPWSSISVSRGGRNLCEGLAATVTGLWELKITSVSFIIS